MPKYRNKDAENDRALGEFGMVAAGKTVITPYYLPMTSGIAGNFELVEDGPAPWVTLVDGDVPGYAITGEYGLCVYPRLRINNKSEAELIVYANGDESAPLKCPAGELLWLNNSQDINSLTFSGSGEINVVAFKQTRRPGG
jgi:hypothetical protein